MAILVKILAAIGAAVVLLFSFAFYQTTGSSPVVDQFFESIQNGDITQAYDQLDPKTQQGFSETGFKNYLNQVMLTDLKSFETTKTGFNSKTGENFGANFKVTVASSDNTSLELKVRAERTSDVWKIRTLTFPDNANSESVMKKIRTASVPSSAELGKLLMATNVVFAHSAKDQDFTLFRAHASKALQDEFSVERLNKAYQPVYKIGDELLKIIEDEEKTVMEAEPVIDDKGKLVVKFKTPTENYTYAFQHRYLYENFEWKVGGFKITRLPGENYQKTGI